MSRLPRGWSSWLALTLVVVIAGLVTAGTISKPYTFSPGTTISSSAMNSNFDTIYNEFNGSITDANVSSLSESKTTFSATGHAHSGGTGGAPVQWTVGANITSAASLTITVDGNFFTVAGSTGPITALSTRNSGVFVRLYFTGTPTLTHNAGSLILFGATSYTVTAGDVLTFLSLGSGNWRQVAGPNVLTAATGVTINRSSGGGTVSLTSAIVRKTIDETVNASDVLQNDNELLFALAASDRIAFQCAIFFDSGTTPDIKFAFTVPAAATIAWGVAGDYRNAGGTSVDFAVTSSGTGQETAGAGAGTILHLMLVGTVINGANAGNLQFQWAQNTSDASDTKVRANSWCRKEAA